MTDKKPLKLKLKRKVSKRTETSTPSSTTASTPTRRPMTLRSKSSTANTRPTNTAETTRRPMGLRSKSTTSDSDVDGNTRRPMALRSKSSTSSSDVDGNTRRPVSLRKSAPEADGNTRMGLGGKSTTAVPAKRRPMTLRKRAVVSKSGTDDQDETAPISRPRTLRGRKRIVVNTPIRKPKKRPPPKKKKKIPPPQPKKKKKVPPPKKVKKIVPPQPKQPPPNEADIKLIGDALHARFETWRNFQPLQIKVKKKVRQMVKAKVLPDVPRRAINVALRRHTRSETYLNHLLEAQYRVSLQGVTTHEITDQEREYTKERLEDLKNGVDIITIYPEVEPPKAVDDENKAETDKEAEAKEAETPTSAETKDNS